MECCVHMLFLLLYLYSDIRLVGEGGGGGANIKFADTSVLAK